MSRTRQSQSRVLRTNSTQGGHHEQPMERVQTPLSVQLPPRHDNLNIYANDHKESPHDQTKRGLSSSHGSSASTSPSQSDPSAPASFTNLNKDILTIIFKYFLAPINVSYSGEIAQRRTILLLLNSAFNHLVYDTPPLWAYIPISGPITNHKRAKRSLDHAKRVGLWWVFDLRNDWLAPKWATEEVVHSLLETYLTPARMEHTTHLHIILNTSLVSTVFRHLCRFPAPALQEFKVVRGETEDTHPLDVHYFQVLRSTSFKTEDDMFDAPALRLLQIHFTSRLCNDTLLKSITDGGGPRPNIQHLDLSHQPPIDPEIFYNFLRGISLSLKTLVLRNAGPEIEGEDTNPDPLPTRRGDYHQGTSSETCTYAIVLPCVTSLVIGGMTADYLASLLSTLIIPPITSLGVHGISADDCEGVWSVLCRQPALLSETIQYGQKDHPNRAFGSIGTLELFDVLSSPEMVVGSPSTGAKGNGFHQFLLDQSSLTHIRMRKVEIEFVKAVADMSHPENDIINIPAPALECLEACCIVKEDLDDPAVLLDVETALVDVLCVRLDCGHRIGRLHLDGDEWGMQKRTRANPPQPSTTAGDKFMKRLAELGEGSAPIVHWDARAPFFADYYDSQEI